MSYAQMALVKFAMALACFLASVVANAAEFDSAYTRSVFEDNGSVPISTSECIPASLVHMYIVKKLDSNLFETISMINGERVARGALKTSNASVSGTGYIDLKVRYRGVKDAELENGFTAKFGLWEECK